VYGTVRVAFVVFVCVLIGMIIGGGASLAASIITHLFGPVFHHPVLAITLAAGIIIGCWIGTDRATVRIGEYEAKRAKHKIDVGGDGFSS
jgi:uncharacterized membrane protein (DUF106 family)